MREKETAMLITAMIFLLSACSSPEADITQNIADDGISGIKPPEGCQVIENLEDFEPVKGDQSYKRNTDASTSFDVLFGGTDTGEALYVNINRNWLIYCDKKSGESGLLCGKPDCEHADDTCNSFLRAIWGVQYYNGNLYTVQSNEKFLLKKISVDGSEREDLGTLMYEDRIQSSKYNGGTIEWLIHRGYVYYCYKWNAGDTTDTYYLNGNNCIYRRSLEKDSKPECIMALPELSLMEECQFMSEGSYVYIIIPTAEETKGWLYRYNIESGKLEWFKEWGNEIANVAVHDNKIYYSENNMSECKTKMYCYDTETKEKKELFEIDGLAGAMMYDDDYMYIAYEEKNEIWKKGVWNWNGEYIAELPSYNKFNEEGRFRDLAGSDENNIYIYCMVANPEEENIYNVSVMGAFTIIEYIEKEDILDGEYEIKEWSEIAEE